MHFNPVVRALGRFGLSVAISVPLLVTLPFQASAQPSQRPCADPRGADFCNSVSADDPVPGHLVCGCVLPPHIGPEPKLRVTPSSAAAGDMVTLQLTDVPALSRSTTVFVDWEGSDGSWAILDPVDVAPDSEWQVVVIVPSGASGEGQLCLRKVPFNGACATFSIVPDTSAGEPGAAGTP